MKRILVVLLALGLLVACSVSGWAMASEYSEGFPIFQQTDWPAGLADLLKDGKPVYAYWVNFADYFYYAGDTDAFNAFLEKYSKLKDTPLTVSIHIGPARMYRISMPEEKNIPFDWQVFVCPPTIPDGGIVKGREHERIVTVELWLGGQVELKKVKVPDNVKVVDGGEIAKFIAEHGKG